MRLRLLSDEEIRKFWIALDGAPMTSAVATILRLALVTGQRIGEVAGMSKAEIDISSQQQIWTLPGQRTKNRLVTRIPLSPPAVELLETAIEGAGDSSFVFPSPTADAPIRAHAATRAIVRTRPMLGLDNFRVHDLRRTVATSMASLGINPHTISSRGTVTGAVYVRYSFDNEKRHALNTWAGHLEKRHSLGQSKNDSVKNIHLADNHPHKYLKHFNNLLTKLATKISLISRLR